MEKQRIQTDKYTNDSHVLSSPLPWERGQGVRLLHLFIVFFITTGCIYSQPYATVREYEKAIQEQFRQASMLAPDSLKASFHENIEELMDGALILPGAFAYPFDSLKKVGKIVSRDGNVRIFTWELLRNDGSHHYYGFIMCRRINPENPLVIRLTDHSEDISNPAAQVLGPDTWLGALYYDIIERKWNNTTLYTLLGYDPNDIFTSCKIIDCFYLKENAIPVFGAPLFMMHNKIQNRVVLEYSAKVSMSLRYNENMKMIVFDHLSPAKPSYEGNYEFYGPDFSYDAFKFINNCWVLVENIDIRNK